MYGVVRGGWGDPTPYSIFVRHFLIFSAKYDFVSSVPIMKPLHYFSGE